MDVLTGAVAVLMHVQSAAQDVPSGADAEVDEHDADAEFEVGGDGFVAVQGDVFGNQNDDAEDEERYRMSGAPGCADPDALPDVPLFSDDVGDCDYVVGISGVFQAEQETESEDSEYAGVDVHMSLVNRSAIKYESQVSTDWKVGLKRDGTPGGIRTPDPLVRSQMLCPLSYGRTFTRDYANWGGVDGGS